MLLFSIPVHEKPDVINNQINNFLYFNPGDSIVLHISRNIDDSDFNEINKIVDQYTNVYINSERLYSGWADGSLIKIHLSNFKFALTQNINFTHVCLHASNDMFVKQGLRDWIGNFDAGFDQIRTGKNNPVHLQIEHFKLDFLSRKLFYKFKLTKVLGSQIEGSFYSKKMIELLLYRIPAEKLWDFPFVFSIGYHKLKSIRYFFYINLERLFRRLNFPFRITIFCREEIYFPSFVYDEIKSSRKFNYCYINWNKKLELTKREIDWVSNNNNQALFNEIELSTEDIKDVNFFAVKRIDRVIDNELRQYINSLQL